MNNSLKVIAIHKQGNNLIYENYGDFLYPIIQKINSNINFKYGQGINNFDNYSTKIKNKNKKPKNIDVYDTNTKVKKNNK